MAGSLRFNPTRRTYVYIAGLLITGLGILMCLAVLLFGVLHLGDLAALEARAKVLTIRGSIGLILVLTGFVAMAVGSPSLQDSEQDDFRLSQNRTAECPSCQALNDVSARFCDQCGNRL